MNSLVYRDSSMRVNPSWVWKVIVPDGLTP
jgi:hypothetical protein